MNPPSLPRETLLLLIDDLLELEVLELIPSETIQDAILIPYMMNDAVEYYLTLTNCQVMGQIPEEFPGETLVKLVDTDERKGFIFEMPDGEKLTLWFDRCEAVRNFYQYHRIGHFWRKGEEHWRMLVYMIGTIHDKYAFLGPEAVNAEELKLLPLVHFGPFRSYSPIDEPLDDRYPENDDGRTAMRALALAAGDTNYAQKIDRAEALKKLPFFRREASEKMLTEALLAPERRQLFDYIYKKVCEASSRYPERAYDAATETFMENERLRAASALYKEGFTGDYPLFIKDGTTALALEEHPFTVQELDYEGFSFQIRIMVWKRDECSPTILSL